MNHDYIQHLVDIRTEYESSIPNCPPILIAGLLVPKGGHDDCFSLDTKMTIEEAESYHNGQITVMAEKTKVDFLLCALVSYSEEAIGMCNVAGKVNLPIVISFTTGIDGRLYSGELVKVSFIINY